MESEDDLDDSDRCHQELYDCGAITDANEVECRAKGPQRISVPILLFRCHQCVLLQKRAKLSRPRPISIAAFEQKVVHCEDVTKFDVQVEVVRMPRKSTHESESERTGYHRTGDPQYLSKSEKVSKRNEPLDGLRKVKTAMTISCDPVPTFATSPLDDGEFPR